MFAQALRKATAEAKIISLAVLTGSTSHENPTIRNGVVLARHLVPALVITLMAASTGIDPTSGNRCDPRGCDGG